MYNNGDPNLPQQIFELDHTITTKILRSCRSLKAEDIRGKIPAEFVLLVDTDIAFMVTN